MTKERGGDGWRRYVSDNGEQSRRKNGGDVDRRGKVRGIPMTGRQRRSDVSVTVIAKSHRLERKKRAWSVMVGERVRQNETETRPDPPYSGIQHGDDNIDER